jgi:hypothetical protein
MTVNKDSILLRPAFEEGALFLKDVIQKGLDKDDKDRLRSAMTSVSSYTRLKAVENNESMISLSIARDFSENKKELKVAIRHSLPEFITN